MPSIFDWLSARILAFMGLLGIIRARRQSNVMDAFADILQSAPAELYREVELYIIDHWADELAAFDVHGQGLEYFVGEASANRPVAMLLEAACRLKGVQLAIWDMDRHRSELFGRAGPLHTVVVEDRYFIALIGQPLEPWHQAVAREIAPGTSARGDERVRPEQLVPVLAGPEHVLLLPVDHISGGEHREVVGGTPQEDQEEYQQQAARAEGAQISNGEGAPGAEEDPAAGGHEDQAAGEEWRMEVEEEPAMEEQPVGEVPVPAAAPAPTREEEEDAEDARLAFRPSDIGSLPPHMAAELAAPTTSAYTVHHGKIFCRLPHCRVPDKEFATIGAWRKHVALARSHLQDPFCALCGHFIIVPQDIDEEIIRAYITAHKRERCVAASKTVLKRRRAEAARLEGLLRNTSHILQPDEPTARDGSDIAEQQPAMRRKRTYESEDARRADICVGFLKRFKADQPQLMAQIATERQLELP